MIFVVFFCINLLFFVVGYPDFNYAYTEWKAGRTTVASAMRSLGMKANTFYHKVKEVEDV
jgi:hypothetical protein